MQWYYNGSPIPGANEVTYTPAVEGIYQVAAINGPCIVWSVEIDFIFQSVENYLTEDILIFPNPNSGIFNCSFTLTEKQDIELIISNLLGEELIKYFQPEAFGKIFQEINIPGNNSGIYFLTIKGISGSNITKIIVD